MRGFTIRARVALVVGASFAASLLLAQLSQAAPDVLLLRVNEPLTPDPAKENASLLFREVVRQAILIAARDEMGLTIRDEVLREWPAAQARAAAGAVVLDVNTRFVPFGSMEVEVARLADGGAAPEVLLSRTWTLRVREQPNSGITEVVELFAGASAGEFVEMLKRAGFEARPLPPPDDGACEAEVESRLAKLTFFSQFAAVRALHDQVRREGRSAARVEALTRAYANLEQASRYQWNAFSAVFAARGLLYAERDVAAAPKSASARWHRAYTRAMLGLHARALDDLAEAAKLASPNEAPPPWVEVIDASCRYDMAALRNLARRPAIGPLASFLAFTAAEHGVRGQAIEAAYGALRDEPANLRVIEGLAGHAGVALMHETSTMGLQKLQEVCFDAVLDQPDLPDAVADKVVAIGKKVADAQSMAQVARALTETAGAMDDACDPSWAVLGAMIEDSLIACAFRQVDLVARGLGAGAEATRATIDELGPIIANHRLRPILDAYATMYAPQRPDEILQKLPTRDLTPAVYHAIKPWQTVKVGSRTLDGWTAAHAGTGAFEIERSLRHVTSAGASWVPRVRRLLDVSPHNPTAIAFLIKWDWSNVAAQAAQWEREKGDMPAIAAALGERYRRLGRYDEAIRCWERYLKLAPDVEAVVQLATVYELMNDEANYLRTMNRAYDLPDPALHHASVAAMTAGYFMDRGDYARAEPHAQRAASSGSGWGMLCLAQCFGGLARLDEGRQLMDSIARRYPEHEMYAYLWYLQFDPDNAAVARAPVEALLGAREPARPGEGSHGKALLAQLDGNLLAAAEQYRALYKQSQWWAPYLALVLDELGDAAGRDAVFAAFATDDFARLDGLGTVALVRMMRDYLAQGSAARWDHDAAAHVLANLASDQERRDRTKLNYLIGKFLDLRGRQAEAIPYYRAATRYTIGSSYERELAWHRLRQLAAAGGAATQPAAR
jgi:tetratricopeptide (TPR) repeat protein